MLYVNKTCKQQQQNKAALSHKKTRKNLTVIAGEAVRVGAGKYKYVNPVHSAQFSCHCTDTPEVSIKKKKKKKECPLSIMSINPHIHDLIFSAPQPPARSSAFPGCPCALRAQRLRIFALGRAAPNPVLPEPASGDSRTVIRCLWGSPGLTLPDPNHAQSVG